jgi:hypothetical protein
MSDESVAQLIQKLDLEIKNHAIVVMIKRYKHKYKTFDEFYAFISNEGLNEYTEVYKETIKRLKEANNI